MDRWSLGQREKCQSLSPPSSHQPVRRNEKDGYAVFFEEHFASMVAELANSGEIVFEGGHDLDVANG